MKAKRILIPIILLCSAVLIVSVFMANKKESDAQKTITIYKAFVEDITQIRLRKTVDSNICAVFSDEDLLNVWKWYFEASSFTYIKEFDSAAQNGGNKAVDFISDNNTLTFRFFEDDKLYIIIDNMLFSVESNINCPFDESYRIAAERNYIVNV